MGFGWNLFYFSYVVIIQRGFHTKCPKHDQKDIFDKGHNVKENHSNFCVWVFNIYIAENVDVR